MPVASPCQDLCGLDKAGRYCLGCLRSREEIAGWSQMNDDQRLKVLAIVARRREENRLQAENPGNGLES